MNSGAGKRPNGQRQGHHRRVCWINRWLDERLSLLRQRIGNRILSPHSTWKQKSCTKTSGGITPSNTSPPSWQLRSCCIQGQATNDVLCRMFLFGRPYFSGNSLIHIFKFDPPPYQTTSSFLTSSPGPIDPSNPHNDPLHTLKEINEKGGKGKWPPDALRLYYSPFSPYDPFLSLDSRRGQSFMWRQDRWYVDMRGDVDQEGWEYAFYWNGRWRWCGGNWHGQARLVHAWVRRRKWIRELIRKNVSPAQKVTPPKHRSRYVCLEMLGLRLMVATGQGRGS